MSFWTLRTPITLVEHPQRSDSNSIVELNNNSIPPVYYFCVFGFHSLLSR